MRLRLRVQPTAARTSSATICGFGQHGKGLAESAHAGKLLPAANA